MAIVTGDWSTPYSFSVIESGGGTDPENPGTDEPIVYTFNEVKKLINSDFAEEDGLGYSVDISADGRTVILGTYNRFRSGVFQGAGYVFESVNGVWVEKAVLTQPFITDNVYASDFFGRKVAISGNGTTIAISAETESVGTIDQQGNGGKLYIYSKTNDAWVLQAEIEAGDVDSIGAAARFGSSICISDDGNTVVSSAPYAEQTPYTNMGAVYIFTRSNGVWTQHAKLVGTVGNDTKFGFSTSISGDGKILAISRQYSTGGNGRVFIYALNNGTWALQAELTSATAGISEYFGMDLAVNYLGDVVIVSDVNSTTPSSPGEIHVFKRTGTSWSETASITPADLADTTIYASIDISGDGLTIVVGGNSSLSKKGSIYVYRFSETLGEWVFINKFTASDVSVGSKFGSALAVDSIGEHIVVGAYLKTVTYAEQGCGYILNRSIVS